MKEQQHISIGVVVDVVSYYPFIANYLHLPNLICIWCGVAVLL
jgi:hypothetical protein